MHAVAHGFLGGQHLVPSGLTQPSPWTGVGPVWQNDRAVNGGMQELGECPQPLAR